MAETLVFAQGQTATFTAQFVTSPAGMPIDVPDATIELLGPSASVVLAATPMVAVLGLTGFYYYDYVIPNSLPTGVYTVLITGTVLGTPTAATQYLQVLAAGTSTSVTFSQRKVELMVALESYIGCAQHIPVYTELARRNKNYDQYQMTFPRWNLGNHEVRLNGEIIDSGFAINYDTGTITFTAPLHVTDRVEVTYNFRFFSQIDILRFLSDALGQINLEPPGTNFTLDTVPDSYVGVLMHGAAKNAIQALIFCLMFQEPSKVFGDPDRVQEIVGSLNTLKENHEKEFTADKKQIKKAVYPKIGVVVTPEYTLPGGRSRWFRYLFSTGGS